MDSYHLHKNVVSPPSVYTASTAVAACYGYAAFWLSATGQTTTTAPTYCVLYHGTVQIMSMHLSSLSSLTKASDDTVCTVPCVADGDPARDSYSVECCGGDMKPLGEFYSVYKLNLSL